MEREVEEDEKGRRTGLGLSDIGLWERVIE